MAAIKKEVESKLAAPTGDINLGDLPPTLVPALGSTSAVGASIEQSRNTQDYQQHFEWLLDLEQEHLEHIEQVTKGFLLQITEKVKVLNPVERLEQLKTAEKNIDGLTASAVEQMQESPKMQQISNLAIQHATDIVKDPEFMSKKAQEIVEQGVADVRGYLSILLAGDKDEIGVIPKLEASIAAATARFAKGNTEIFQPLVDRVKRLTAVEATIKGITDLHLTDPDDEAHYKILLTGFGEKLNASIKAAVEKFVGSNAGFQSIVDRVKRFAAVEATIKGITDLHLTDLDEEAHYGALLTDFGNKLHASIATAMARFAQDNVTFQSVGNRVKRLAAVEAAMKRISDLHLTDPDEEAHYGALLAAFGNKLQASIEEAKKYFAAQPFLTKSGLARLDDVREEIKGISSVGIKDEDTKMHYLTLLQEECNKLEESLGLAVTKFAELSEGFKKQSSIARRLQR